MINHLQKYSLEDLIHLMARLREPEYGCPWDIKQSYKSITSSTIEEVYEVVDTIERNDIPHLKEELGDLLFQIVFYSQLGAEDKHFDFADVVQGITEKLIRRHPHVFPEGTLESRREIGANSVDEDQRIKAKWEEIKQAERVSKGVRGTLDDIPISLPALTRAFKLQKRASSANFDWRTVEPVVQKVFEEIDELQQAVEQKNSLAIEEEMGDILFTCVNLARHLTVEPEAALRRSNTKFELRFKEMEKISQKEGTSMGDLDDDALDRLWLKAKAELTSE